MAIQMQNIPYKFDAGLDQEVDSQVLDPESGMVVVENAVFRRLGRIEKRLPMAEALDRETVDDSSDGGVGFANEQSHTLLATRPSLAVQGATSQRALNRAGERLEPGIVQHSAEVERIDTWYTGIDALQVDACVVDGYTITVYSQQGTLIVRVVELVTGQVVLEKRVVGTGSDVYSQCRVEPTTNAALIFTVADTDHQNEVFDIFELNRIDLSDPSNITLTEIDGAIDSFVTWSGPHAFPLPFAFDTSHDDAGNVYLIYDKLQYILKAFDSSGTETASVNVGGASLGQNHGPPAVYAAHGVDKVFVVTQPATGAPELLNTKTPEVFRYDRDLTNELGPGNGPKPRMDRAQTNLSGLWLRIGMVRLDATSTPRIAIAFDDASDQCSVENWPYTVGGGAALADGVPGQLVAKPHYQRVGDQFYPIFLVQKPNSFDVTGALDADDNQELRAQPNILIVAFYGVPVLDDLDNRPIANCQAFGHYDVLDAISDSPQAQFPSVTGMITGQDADRITKWMCPYLIRGATANKLVEVSEFEGPVLEARRTYKLQFASGCASVVIDYTLELPLTRTELGDAVYTGAACLQSFTGDAFIRESSFHFRPILWPSDVTVIGSGGSLSAGQYFYAVTWERHDGNGDLIRSEISRTIVVDVVDSGSVSFNFHSPMYYSGDTQGRIYSDIRVKIFRSQADGSILLFAGEVNDNSGRGDFWPRFDSYLDTVADVDLLEETPYPIAQILRENNPPPAPYHHTEWRNRMVLVNNQDRDELWISNVKANDSASNRLGVEFSFTQTIRIAAGPGDIEAVASIDEKLLIFKPESIYMIQGEGPAPNGLGGTFSQPIERSSEVGCINKRSVITTEVGIFFQSRGGIMLMNRAMELEFVGHGVTDILPGTTVGVTALVKRAVLISELKEVRFLLDDADQSVLCYHYRFQRWSVLKYFDIAERNDSAPDFRLQDIARFEGIFHALVVDARSGLTTVYKETEQTEYRDGQTDGFSGDRYQMTLTTPAFKLANLTGFQRLKNVRFLMDYIDEHDLVIDISYNDDETNLSTYTFEDADIVSTDTSSYVVRIKPGKGKSRSIRFRLRDQREGSSSGSSGAGFRAIHLSMEAAVKTGGFRIGATNKR